MMIFSKGTEIARSSPAIIASYSASLLDAACLRRVYQVSTLDRDFLTKNMGLCFRFSSSLNNVVLTEISKIAK